ncbi:vesicle transport protein SEC20 [Daktulosphaira vitifoliae]|uniref:vesicle transport protein SEC20 n=1 Tax=Daktulosphaira vitifoliae TaxID=58002 RepID=UPI0021AA5A89|nr:vesicle transport protein SEC20 [Daktulosphaira vitifoliae]
MLRELSTIRECIVNTNVSLKSVIQDIYLCDGPIESLTRLNDDGRKQINIFRNLIENLELFAQEAESIQERSEVMEEVRNQREYLTSNIASFRKANVECMARIHKKSSDQLFSISKEEQVRHRLKMDKENLLKQSSTVTDQLLSVSRQLANTSQQSLDSLDILLKSSSTVHNISNEIKNSKGALTQSEKLLNKYGQRETTDKILIIFAFAFFLCVVAYIVHKRLF